MSTPDEHGLGEMSMFSAGHQEGACPARGHQDGASLTRPGSQNEHVQSGGTGRSMSPRAGAKEWACPPPDRSSGHTPVMPSPRPEDWTCPLNPGPKTGHAP